MRCSAWDTQYHVAPFTGAWIEICHIGLRKSPKNVAPFTGAWIEIWSCHAPLSWRLVAPFTGAWIEIHACARSGQAYARRSLHGSVD